MLSIEYRPLDSLIPYARNSRTHSDEQISQIAASIREFGFTNPVLIDEQSGIIAGHGRVLGAAILNMEQVPTITIAGLSEAQKRAARLWTVQDRKQSDLWQCARPKSSPLHPTTKPVELIERAVQNSSNAGALLFEPFSGSGTLLIAAERNGRVSYNMELDPCYIDVAVKRWQDFTGQQATLEGDGRTFAEVSAARPNGL